MTACSYIRRRQAITGKLINLFGEPLRAAA